MANNIENKRNLNKEELDKVIGGCVDRPYGQRPPLTSNPYDKPSTEAPPEPQVIQR